MQLRTRQFGEITIEPSKQIIFPEGLPGFETLRQFILLEDEEEGSLFSYLQSVEQGEVSFILMNPYQIMPEYNPIIKEAYFEKLGGGTSEEFALLSMVTIPQQVAHTTLNLQAPLLFHIEKRRGIQVILEKSPYKTKHLMLELMKKVVRADVSLN